MCSTAIKRLFIALGMLPGCVAFADAAGPADIGTVTFMVGDAWLERNGQTRLISLNQALQVGDRLSTGPDGHVHARMVDNAFISVRPSSRLQIQHYSYAPQNPLANRVGLLLESGTTRTISGKAGEANRQHYRFNTPLAAIGLRGTDYVVQAQPDVTRVSVLKGAIALSAFGQGCLADTLSPCSGPQVRELLAGDPQAYLEVRAQGGLPQLVLPGSSKDTGPNKAAPPRPEESGAAVERPVTGTLLSQTLLDERAKAQADTDAARLAHASAQALAERLSLRPEVIWGRWTGIALSGTPTLVSLQTDDREVTIGNALFGLLRPAGASQFPAAGTLAMNYLQGEAYIKDTSPGASQALLPVSLSQGVLQLDFNNKQFTTRLSATTAAQTIALQAQGQINFQGMLYADPARSNMNVEGALSNQANEAGYLFNTLIAPNQTLLGATRWSR